MKIFERTEVNIRFSTDEPEIEFLLYLLGLLFHLISSMIINLIFLVQKLTRIGLEFCMEVFLFSCFILRYEKNLSFPAYRRQCFSTGVV